jgi:hypothetical protein
MKSAKQRLEQILDETNNSYNSLAKEIGLKRSQNLYDIEKGKVKNISFELATLINNKFPQYPIIWLQAGEGQMLDSEVETSKDKMQKHLNGVKNNKDNSVPIAEIDFTGGFVELLENASHPNIIGKIDLPQFRGCDIIVTCQNDSMSDVVNPSDFVGIRRIYDKHDLEYGKAIYGVVTSNFRLFKYIDAADKAEHITLKSENKKYTDRTLHLDKILELWVVQAVMPASKIKVYL